MNWEKLIVNLECIDNLPTLPTVFTKVSELINQPNSTIRDIAQVIETDQAIAIRLLKIVNSPFFGFSRKIMTVQDAVTLLGLSATRNTVASVSVFKAFGKVESAHGFDVSRFWRHAIATGIVARFIGKKLRTSVETAFIAGIIHDIGKIILHEYFVEELEQVLASISEKELTFYDAEIDVYRGSHCDLGSYLADKWNLPVPLIEVIDLHHNPGEATEDPKLVSIVHIANQVANTLGFITVDGAAQGEMDHYAFARLDLAASDLESWLEDIQVELEQAEDLLNAIK